MAGNKFIRHTNSRFLKDELYTDIVIVCENFHSNLLCAVKLASNLVFFS